MSKKMFIWFLCFVAVVFSYALTMQSVKTLIKFAADQQLRVRIKTIELEYHCKGALTELQAKYNRAEMNYRDSTARAQVEWFARQVKKQKRR
jgi:hypothetical protein